MDLFKAKQPIALPLDSEDEKLLKPHQELDPELAVDVPQQQEGGRRCCFAKGKRGRRIRLVGHFLVLGALLHWFWGPSIQFYHGNHQLPEVTFSDFTDLDGIPSTVPQDFLWVSLPLPPNKTGGLIGILGRFRFQRGIGM